MAGALVVAMATKVSRTDQKPMAWKLWTCCVAGNVLVSYGIEPGGRGEGGMGGTCGCHERDPQGRCCGDKDAHAEETPQSDLARPGERGVEEHRHWDPEEERVRDDVARQDRPEDRGR